MGWYIGSKLRDKAGSRGGGVVVGLFYREQKHICGKDYDTAAYMEVDLYPVSAKKHKASRRAKKKEASSLAQQTYKRQAGQTLPRAAGEYQLREGGLLLDGDV